MTTLAIRTEHDRKRLIDAAGIRPLPFVAEMKAAASIRSEKQNKLQRKWLKESSEQGDNTPEQYRAYCKLHFGVAIMKFESEQWAEAYDRIIKPLTYEQKLEMMAEPMDFPVTRCMSPKGKAQYLDEMYKYFTGLGFVLTEPEQK